MEGGKLPGGTTQYAPGSTGPSIPLNCCLNSVSCGRCDKSENNLSRCIILKCSRSEFQNGSHWAKIKGLAGLSPSKPRGENSVLASSSFQRSLAFLGSWTLPLSSEPTMAEQVFPRLPSLCVLTQILPFVRTLVITWSPPRYSKLSPYFKVR